MSPAPPRDHEQHHTDEHETSHVQRVIPGELHDGFPGQLGELSGGHRLTFSIWAMYTLRHGPTISLPFSSLMTS